MGAALGTSAALGGAGAEIAALARQAFVESMRTSLWLGAAVGVAAMVVALVFMRRQPALPEGDPEPSTAAQGSHAEHVADRQSVTTVS